jgi:GNAT superfamily N-acetyltransferase
VTKQSCDGRSAGPAPLPDGYHVFPAGKILNVVTWLEMRAPPAMPFGEPLPLERVRRPDPAWYRALFLRVGAPWLWSMHLDLDDAALAAAIGDPALHVFVAREEGEDIGLVVLDRSRAGAVEILDFGLVPEAVGRGLGRRMMAAALPLQRIVDRQRLVLDRRLRSGHGDDRSASSSTVISTGLPMLTGPVTVVGVHSSGASARRSGRRRSRRSASAAVAVDRDRRVPRSAWTMKFETTRPSFGCIRGP